MKHLLLQGHQRPITCVTFNPDGDLLFTAGKDARLCVWWTEGGKQLGTYDCGKGVIWNADCSLDGTRLIASSADMKVLIFDVETGALLFEAAQAGPVRYVEWNRKPNGQDRFVMVHDSFGSQSTKAIKVWALDDDHPFLLWKQDDYPSRAVRVHWGPFDRSIFSCHENGDIYVWDAATGNYVTDFQAHKSYVTCMSFSKDRLLMLTASSDGTAKLWDTVNFRCLKTYNTDRPLNACDISPRFARKGDDRKCHILLGGGQAAEEVTTTGATEGKFQALLYHTVHTEEIGAIKGHFSPINTLAFIPDGNGYVSGGEESIVRLYNFDDSYFTDKYD